MSMLGPQVCGIGKKLKTKPRQKQDRLSLILSMLEQPNNGTKQRKEHKMTSFYTEEELKGLGFRHIGFTLGETILITRRLEGDFLNWRKAVPEAFRYHMTLEREELKSAADRVSLVVDERTKNPLRCHFEDGVVTLSCVTALGQAEDACLAEGTGGGLEIGFNSRYLIDALKAAPAQRIVVSISTGSSPCVITPEEGDGFLYMILPVRLRTE